MTSDKERLTAVQTIINENDEVAEAIGEEIKDVLKLKKDPDNKGRFITSSGSKYPKGIARVAMNIFMDYDFDLDNGKLGSAISETFKLRKESGYADRFQTTWGSKTYLGLSASIARILYEGAEKHLAAEEDDSQRMS